MPFLHIASDLAFPLWKSGAYALWNRFYFTLHKEKTTHVVRDQLTFLQAYQNDAVLFAGFIKSGNTWLRFLIYNYFNILNNQAEETLSYSELNQIQPNALGDPLTFVKPNGSLPYITRTHRHYSKALEIFKRGIYVYRNPLDTLVSAYHFHKNRENPDFGNPSKSTMLANIDNFVNYNLVFWQVHVDSYMNRSDFLHIKYENLLAQPQQELRTVLSYLGFEPNENVIQKSIELSSFQSIQQMGRMKNEASGNGGANFKGEFARKGKVGSYLDELKPATINRAKPLMKKYGFISAGC